MQERNPIGAADSSSLFPLPSVDRRTREPVSQPKPVAPAISDLDTSYKAWAQRPSDTGLGKIVEHAKPVIQQAAVTYAGSQSPLVLSRGRILAAQAVKSYKPDSGVSLRGWMMRNLQGLNRYRQQLTPIRAPERAMLDYYRMQQAVKEHQEEMGELPDDLELGRRTGFSPRRLQKLRRMNQSVTPESSLLDDEGSTYLPGVGNDSEQAIWAEMVYHDLDPMNRKIYDMLTGRGVKPHTPSQVANKLRLSVGAISQRTQKISQLLALGQSLRGS